jgi:predicted adenylyl cyclase CyaB
MCQEDSMTNIGEKIKEIRIKNNLTQQELADKLYVSDKTISSYESGRTLPDINTLIEISNVLNVSIVNFVTNTNDENIEIEFKIKVNRIKFNELLKKIKDDSIFVREEDQIATYFKPNFRKFNNEWLRVRKENNNNVLNYKKKNESGDIEEYEVLIDNYEKLKSIFNYLGLEDTVVVSKHRISYLYRDKYEISFDEVDNLGLYVEIEVKKYNYENEKEIELLIDLIKEFDINMSDIETKRYPELMQKVD